MKPSSRNMETSSAAEQRKFRVTNLGKLMSLDEQKPQVLRRPKPISLSRAIRVGLVMWRLQDESQSLSPDSAN